MSQLTCNHVGTRGGKSECRLIKSVPLCFARSQHDEGVAPAGDGRLRTWCPRRSALRASDNLPLNLDLLCIVLGAKASTFDTHHALVTQRDDIVRSAPNGGRRPIKSGKGESIARRSPYALL